MKKFLLLSLAGVGVFPGVASGTAVVPRDSIKMMIIGDSISQGHEGDYTWRYRLWQWTQSSGIAVDFVGPYNGTHAPDAPAPPSPPLLQGETEPAEPASTTAGYAVDVLPGFSHDHFALWGYQAAQYKDTVAGQVRAYDPDYLLVELGFNDIAWYVSDPQGTLASMKKLVDNARSVKPTLRFAIANIPQRTYLGRDDLPAMTDEYNGLLANSTETWSTAASPVQLVRFRENYQCELESCPAGYDGLHPNALGEYQIARAFSLVLYNSYGMGSSALSVPDDVPARSCPAPTSFLAQTSPSGIMVTWDAVYGAFGYEVQSRVKGATSWDSAVSVSTNRYDKGWIPDGYEYEFQGRTSCGDTIKSGWTDVSSAVVRLETAPGPTNITTHATADGLALAWSPPSGAWDIDRYAVITYDKDTPGAYIQGVGIKGTTASISGLILGHHYSVWMTTWTDKGGGLPLSARGVTVNTGTPPAPDDLQVTSVDAVTVQLRWTGSPSAFGYRFWVRNINDGSASKADESYSDVPCYGVTYLIPGVWNYEFCVSAFNGNDESARGNCVVATAVYSNVASCPSYVPTG